MIEQNERPTGTNHIAQMWSSVRTRCYGYHLNTPMAKLQVDGNFNADPQMGKRLIRRTSRNIDNFLSTVGTTSIINYLRASSSSIFERWP